MRESTKTREPSFAGKPDTVTHNRLHHDGDLGRTHDHQPVVVEKDHQYYERQYYSDRDHTWFWYDLPLAGLVPKQVFICGVDSDDCHLRPDGVIAEGPGDAGGGISYAPPPQDCTDKRLASRHAYSVCEGDFFWHVRTDNYYCCPPNKTLFVQSSTGPATTQACGAGGAGGAGGDKAVDPGPPLPKRPDVCSPAQEIDPITVTFCNGQNWVTREYSVVSCDGKEFTNGVLSEIAAGTCDQPEPPYTPTKKCQ